MTRWTAPLLWMLLIFVVSGQSTLPHADEAIVDVLLKKTAHFSEYFILCLLWVRALLITSNSRRKQVLIACLISGVYAITDEVHQAFVPGRHPSIMDVFIDWVGIMVAAVAAIRLSKKLT